MPTLFSKLDPVPSLSSIQITAKDGSIEITWLNPSGGIRRYASGFVILPSAALMAIMVVALSPNLIDGGVTAFQTTWFALFFVGFLFYSYMAFRLLGPRRPDILRLKHDSLDYIPGSRPLSGFRRYYRMGIPWGHRIELDQFIRYDKSLTLERQRIDRFELEWVNDNVELCAVFDEKSHVIGEYLDWEEREWMLELLNNWKAGGCGIIESPARG